MTLETFTTTIVPGIASLAYASAGFANLYARHYALATMWICYSVANICLIATVSAKR